MSKSKFSGGLAFGVGSYDVVVNDPGLVDLLASYKRRIAGQYRPLSPNDVASIPPSSLVVSRKIDGELWFVVSDDDGVYLANPRGRAITGKIPVLERVKTLPMGTILAGELHVAATKGRERVGDLSALLSGGKKADTKTLCFAAFDLVQKDGATALTAPYKERFSTLQALVPASGFPLSLIETATMSGAADLQSHYKTVVEDGGAEGLIVRASTGMVYKLKPVIDIDCVLLAYTEKIDEPGHVRSVLLGLMHEDGKVQLLGGCGNLGSMAQRKALFDRLSKSVVTSRVRYASDSGGLYRFVSPEIVVSVKVTDLQTERSDGTILTAPLLSFDKTSGWQSHGVRPCPRPIHPVLERLRDDKAANPVDIRISQISEWSSSAVPGATPDTLPSSQLLRREVWMKEAKGQTAVRKLVVWKTNKETTNSAFPAFVVHWTDYSVTRATPLDREVRLAPSETIAMKLADEMITENIKKGWNKV
jgi:hypothetical protein